MEKSKEEYCMEVLREVMKDAPVSHYCIGGNREDAVCMVCGEGWQVFTVERGKKYDCVSFPNVVEAGLALIRSVFVLDEPEEHTDRFINGIVG